MQKTPLHDQSEYATADARLAALSGKRLWQVVILGAALTVLFTLSVVTTAFLITSETGTRALETDYRVFWAAGRLALEGDFLSAFDMERLGAIHDVAPEAWMPWLYPPGYLLLIAPFGAPSYAVSLLAFILLSVLAMALAVRPFTGGSWAALVALALAPACLPALIIGQNSMIWFAVLLASLAALRAERWVVAGILIGCLTLKPQMGIMIPVALLAACLWRTILIAIATALVLAILPTLVTGAAYWSLFIDRLIEQGNRLISAIGTLDLMVGPFYLMVRLGLPTDSALTIQGVITVLSALSIFAIWRSDRVCFDCKVATLLTGIFLSASYLWYYEAVLMALVGLFLLRAGILRRRVTDMSFLALLWFGPGPQAMNILANLGGENFPWAAINTPAMFACLAMCLAHYRSRRLLPSGAS